MLESEQKASSDDRIKKLDFKLKRLEILVLIVTTGLVGWQVWETRRGVDLVERPLVLPAAKIWLLLPPGSREPGLKFNLENSGSGLALDVKHILKFKPLLPNRNSDETSGLSCEWDGGTDIIKPFSEPSQGDHLFGTQLTPNEFAIFKTEGFSLKCKAQLALRTETAFVTAPNIAASAYSTKAIQLDGRAIVKRIRINSADRKSALYRNRPKENWVSSAPSVRELYAQARRFPLVVPRS